MVKKTTKKKNETSVLECHVEFLDLIDTLIENLICFDLDFAPWWFCVEQLSTQWLVLTGFSCVGYCAEAQCEVGQP